MSDNRPDYLKPIQYNDNRFSPPPPKSSGSPIRKRTRRGPYEDIPRNISQRDPYPLNYNRGPHNDELDCDDSDAPNEDLYTETFEETDDNAHE